MKLRSNRAPKISHLKTVATMIQEAIEGNGYKDVKECARSIKVPYDLFNKVIGGHIPKDMQLMEYAKKLHIDSRELILAAYRDKAPEEMKRYFNSVMLLEDHNDNVRETLELMDSFNSDQMAEFLNVARLIQKSPRNHCKKTLSLLMLYQQMPPEVMDHFDSLVLMSLRREDFAGLKHFRDEVEKQRLTQKSRRGKRSA